MRVKLKLIKNESPKPKKYRAKSKQESEPIICPECQGDQFIEVINVPEMRNGKWLKKSGFRSLECLTCKTTVYRE